MDTSNRQIIKQKKIDLIKSGRFEDYKDHLKYEWGNIKNNDDWEITQPSKNYLDYGLDNEEALELCERLDKSTHRKKAYARKMLNTMCIAYPCVYMIELGFSNIARENTNIDWQIKLFTRALKHYPHYFGKIELSENGKLHFHGFVATFEPLEESGYVRTRKKHQSILYKDPILQEFWYGESVIDENGTKQPSRYGIYDIVGLNTDIKHSNNKASNYVLKGLNTMTSYIQKDTNSFKLDTDIDEDLLVKVNTHNLIVKRNSPICRYLKEYDNAIKIIKEKTMVFDKDFYDLNKFGTKKAFENWYFSHKDYEPSSYLDVKIFDDSFVFPNLQEMIKEQEMEWNTVGTMSNVM